MDLRAPSSWPSSASSTTTSRTSGVCLRARGPTPTLCDSEVLTIEVVGEFLGLDAKTPNSSPTSGATTPISSRTSCGYTSHHLRARQAANLWKAKELLWQELSSETPHDPTFALADSFPLSRRVCSPAPTALQALRRGGRFRQGHPPQADFLRLRSTREGLLARSDHPLLLGGPGRRPRAFGSARPALAHTWGVVVGDRNYWSPPVREELAGRGVELVAPYRTKKRDPRRPEMSAFLSRLLRYRIDTVFSQLTERYCV
jgi:hypothetical protein